MKWIAAICIICGIITVSYPNVSKYFYASQEQELIEEYYQLTEIFETETMESHSISVHSQLMGILIIDKIDLTLPILHGATDEHLKIGAGHLTSTPTIHEIGNTAIAAHRSYTYGRQFNRLDELESGDSIIVETNVNHYEYIVVDKLIVDPTDVSVLEHNKDISVLTLITCDPIKNPTHRLIVQAEMSK